MAEVILLDARLCTLVARLCGNMSCELKHFSNPLEPTLEHILSLWILQLSFGYLGDPEF